ncbi:MAG: hypothetical protein GF329_04685 [Candidatus Lokiarchaeota archaeon]|nr:hypothetical protein [Candidatus Lokiarchaeota archaeon]
MKNIIEKIKKSYKKFLDNLFLILIITGIWLTLIGLFVFVKIYVVPLTPISPLSGRWWNLITSGVQVLLTVFYCIGGLYVWYRIIKTYFWRIMRKSSQTEEKPKDVIINE